MAAPTTPVAPGFSKAFFTLAIDVITLCSNLQIPLSTDVVQTGVFTGTTATLMVAALTLQRGFV
jgi:hypothetical protein